MATTIRRGACAALFALLLSPSCFADGVLLSWSASDVDGVSNVSFEKAKSMSAKEILRQNPEVTTWAQAFLLMVAAQQYKNDAAFKTALAAQITDGKQAALLGTRRLIIWERITSGEIVFEGKGYYTTDDLFSVAGRANWILRNLTSKTYGYVRPNTPASELKVLREKWTAMLSGKEVEAHRPAIEVAEGLEEIKSLEALEALIVSLKPSAAKERITRDCLLTLYGLDKLPNDPTGPAQLCNPDTYTARYLAVLTGEKGQHDGAWWARWWTDHRALLVWNADQQMFVDRRP